MKRSFYITLGAFIIAAALINILLKKPTFKKLSERADFEIKANHPELADITFLNIVKSDIYKIDNHYNYISNHFEIPEKKVINRNTYEYRDDNTISAFYDSLINSNDSSLSDIGYYGKGLIFVNSENYIDALETFSRIKNKTLKYSNNSIGYVYKHLDSLDKAEHFFRAEIKYNGNISGAYSNLAELLLKKGEKAKLKKMFEGKDTRKYLPTHIERIIYFYDFSPKRYIKSLFKSILININFWGFAAAFLITGCWIIYLRKIDILSLKSGLI